ncbi:MAG: hypothetical protein IT365_06240 [Candidatus Hydrogenedentes bacterium]|nr:hypothetical protein [Candidatus Hydrogenedentota bacterium]
MMLRPRVGLLPLYLKLYDDTMPELRVAFDPFMKQVVDGFETRGVGVVRWPVCRLREEFREAVAAFEREGVDAIVTLHLAYSPSLESVDALVHSALPVVMLDTTMDESFGLDVDPARIMFDHGVHGVQDLASMLRRRGKRYEVIAGHVSEAEMFERACGRVRAVAGARCFRGMRVLRIGETFSGMGDFTVHDDLLQAVLGVRVDQMGVDSVAACAAKIDAGSLEREMREDRSRYDVDVPEEVHRRSVRVGLALRKVLEEGGYGAFSMNFLAFDRCDGPVDTVPFLEASKAMARGLGYAGEGDVLTAALVGALNAAFGMTTFTEIFCPDWRGDALFLSHMGEVNPETAAAKPRLCEKDFPWTGARNPAVLTCAPAPGPAVLVNLAPGPDETFSLIAARVEVLGDGTHPAMRDSVRGWIRPEKGVRRFLEEYSRHGGTHHSALVLGDRVDAVAAFGEYAGIDVVVL